MSLTDFCKRLIFLQTREERQRRYRNFRKDMRKVWEQFRRDCSRTGGIE